MSVMSRKIPVTFHRRASRKVYFRRVSRRGIIGENGRNCTPANSPGFPGSLQVFHQISRELPTVAFSQFFFSLISLSLRCQKGK